METENPSWIFAQITVFNDGKRDMFMDEKKYFYEQCQKIRDERAGMWDLFGDKDFVKSVTYLCIPKRRIRS